MTRSKEALATLRQREAWSNSYDCVSIKQDDDGNDGEAYFSHSGCDVCEGGGSDVYDVVYLAREDIDRQVFDRVYEGQVCGNCLCAIVNGDNSDLDL